MTSGAFSLEGRCVLVTGAAGGIGAATAIVASRLGAEAILVDCVSCDATGAAIAGEGGRCRSFLADVTDRSAMDAVAESAGPLDALVLNAAICPWEEDWTAPGWNASFETVMRVNVFGPLNAARAMLPGMRAQGGGRIVLVGSLAGRMGGLIAGPHYVASKGGVHALVKWLARQVAADGILVNGVAPASVETPLMEGRPVDVSRIPLGRMGRPDEVAWPIAFLCSDAASYVCGTVLDVNGGVYMA